MCGILGAAWRDRRVVDKAQTGAALDAIRHRGPDAEGTFLAPGIFLGHRRLSIIDLDPRSTQPFTSGSSRLVFNGEIYNHKALRGQLEERGISFSTQSDTEVLLKAFQADGLNCLDTFEGMFSFAIYDAERDKLTLVRDRFGEKPMAYFLDDEQLLFGSEVGAIEQMPGAGPFQVDGEALTLYFRYSYLPTPFGPYQGLRQLAPGHWLELDLKTWTVKEGCYYIPGERGARRNASISLDEAKDELRQRLAASVTERFEASDVPVATFLSGGIDSSVISILAARAAGRSITAYSIGFPDDPEFDETPYARQVASSEPNLRHEVIPVREADLSAFAEKTLTTLSEPFADSSIVPTAYLCSNVDEKVILGGDGADEIFAGYGVYGAMRASANLPGWAKRLALAVPAHTNPAAIGNPLLRAVGLFRMHLAKGADGEYLSWRSYARSSDLTALGLSGSDGASLIAPLLPQPQASLRDILIADLQFNMPPDMLKKVDLASMQHGKEVRLPFLDSGLVEFALSLPETFLINRGIRKYILREAFRDMLPPDILTRRKQGFLLPVRKWMKSGPMRDELLDIAGRQTLLDGTTVTRIANEHRDGQFDHSSLLWALLVFFKWQVSRSVVPAGRG